MSSKTSAPPAPSIVSDPQSREQFLESLRLRQTAAEARLNALRSDDPAEVAAALDDDEEEGEDGKRDDEESEESSDSESGSGSDSDSSDAEEGEYENEVSGRNWACSELVLASVSCSVLAWPPRCLTRRCCLFFPIASNSATAARILRARAAVCRRHQSRPAM